MSLQLSKLLGLEDVDLFLESVEMEMAALVEDAPVVLREGCMRQIRGGGKRLRPGLVLAASRLSISAATTGVRDAAVAVELMHTGSLVHDDIIDQATSRRKQATINSTEGEDVALLAGDYLLGLAGRAGIRASQAVGLEMAETIVSLCRGQMTETESVYRPDRSEESYFAAVAGKTAALLSTCCVVGTLSANCFDWEILAALRQFGFHFGVEFQIVDDILDSVSPETDSGKELGKDLLAGVLTLPWIHARESGDQQITALVTQIWEPARVFDTLGRGERLKALRQADVEGRLRKENAELISEAVAAISSSVHLESTVAEARRHAELARQSLASLKTPRDSSDVRGRLMAAPMAYLEAQLHAYL